VLPDVIQTEQLVIAGAIEVPGLHGRLIFPKAPAAGNGAVPLRSFHLAVHSWIAGRH
jgi:hypothetical protein